MLWMRCGLGRGEAHLPVDLVRGSINDHSTGDARQCVIVGGVVVGQQRTRCGSTLLAVYTHLAVTGLAIGPSVDVTSGRVMAG